MHRPHSRVIDDGYREDVGIDGCERTRRARDGSRVEQIGLREEDVLLLIEHRRRVRLELLTDRAVIAGDVLGFCRDEMEEDARALDVAEEFVTEPLPLGRALDEPGHVCEDEAVVGAEMRLQGRERIRTHLGVRAGEGIEERRLAGIREPDETDIGDHLQFEPVPE